jgi:hypothetical protein
MAMSAGSRYTPSDSEQAAMWLENGCRGRLNTAAARILYQHDLTPYEHLDGESGVIAFQIGDDWIKVEFAGKLYLYNHASAGSDKIGDMKSLARSGRKLSGYISRNVREDYAFSLPWPPTPGARTGPRPASHALSKLRR